MGSKPCGTLVYMLQSTKIQKHYVQEPEAECYCVDTSPFIRMSSGNAIIYGLKHHFDSQIAACPNEKKHWFVQVKGTKFALRML